MGLSDVLDSIVRFDVTAVHMASLASWPAVAIALVGIAVAVFGETYKEADGQFSGIHKIARRRITRTGWTSLAIVSLAFALGVRHQASTIQANEEALNKSWWESLDGVGAGGSMGTKNWVIRDDPRYAPLPVLATGIALPVERNPLSVDPKRAGRRVVSDFNGGPVFAKNGDVIDLLAHCPTDNLDWVCGGWCGVMFARSTRSTIPLEEMGRLDYHVAKEASSGKLQIVAMGSMRVHPQGNQLQPFAVNGFPSCEVKVRVRGDHTKTGVGEQSDKAFREWLEEHRALIEEQKRAKAS